MEHAKIMQENSQKERKRRSRSVKDRPNDAQALVEALQAGRLDGRTRHAQTLVAARDAINAAPAEASRALLVGSLSAWAVCQRACLEEVSRAPCLLTDEGRLAETYKTLERVDASLVRLTRTLAIIEEQQRTAATARDKEQTATKAQDLRVAFDVE